ncbi:dolichyl-phosphate beta-D-mannosyltransferase, partial [Candidatus Berkelbacteria bacterium CG_4_9_14_3_um_filter_33_5]
LNKIVDYGIQSSGYALMVETVYFAKRNNYQIAEFPIVFVDRRAGESKISGELKKSAIVVLKLALERFKNL